MIECASLHNSGQNMSPAVVKRLNKAFPSINGLHKGKCKKKYILNLHKKEPIITGIQSVTK